MTSGPSPTQFNAPPRFKFVGEVAAALQLPRLALRSPTLARLPRGHSNVVLFPGFGTGDSALLPLRAMLRSLGHNAVGWNMGLNRGDVEADLQAATDRVEQVVDQTGQPVACIGWSLGGVFAREIARDRPDLVTRVVTLGTPVLGGPRYTRAAEVYGEERLAHIESVVAERNLIPIERPITAFYSKSDGVVDWRPCVDSFSPQVRNICMRSTHVGMTIDPDVWSTIAVLLASDAAT